MQATVRVLLGDGDDEAQVGFDHFLLGLTGFFLAFLDLLHDATEFRDVQANVLADLRHVTAQFLDLVGRAFDEHGPTPARLLRHPVHPVRVQLVTAIFLDKFLAVDSGLVGEFDHGAVDLHDPPVDTVELVDQGFDTIVVQMKFIDQKHDFGAQLLIARFFGRIEGAVLVQGGADAIVLKLGKGFVVVGDPIQGFQNTRLQRGFHGRQRHVGLVVLIVVVVILGDRIAVGIEFGATVFLFRRGADAAGIYDGFFALLVLQRVAEGRFEIDHIAQQNVFGEEFVTPDGNRLKCQRAFAQAGDHRVAASLDAFRDGDLALAAQQFDTAHFAQVHAHRIIGPVELFVAGGANRDVAVLVGLNHCRRLEFLFLGLVVLNDVDPHLGEHRHHVFDLLRGDLIGGQNLVELVIGDEATFAGFRDHLLHLGLAHVERDFRILLFDLGFVVVLGGHGDTPWQWIGAVVEHRIDTR